MGIIMHIVYLLPINYTKITCQTAVTAGNATVIFIYIV